MTARGWLLVALAACGDDRTFGLDASFEGGDARFFGTTSQTGGVLPPPNDRAPIAGAEVCVDEACDVTDDKGTFVLLGPPAPHEGVFTARASGFTQIAIAVIAGDAGDRNIGTLTLQPPDDLTTLATAFGEDPRLDTLGGVLVVTERYDEGPLALAIDGATARYLDAQNHADPTATSIIKSRVLFFGLSPGEVILRSIVGQCDPIRDGWPGATRAEIRLPILAGHITVVRPQCIGN